MKQSHHFRQNIGVNICVHFHFQYIYLGQTKTHDLRHLPRKACFWYDPSLSPELKIMWGQVDAKCTRLACLLSFASLSFHALYFVERSVEGGCGQYFALFSTGQPVLGAGAGPALQEENICSSHHQIRIWISFSFSFTICQTQQKYHKIERPQCCLLGKPHSNSCRHYLGIAQIAFAPPPPCRTQIFNNCRKKYNL